MVAAPVEGGDVALVRHARGNRDLRQMSVLVGCSSDAVKLARRLEKHRRRFERLLRFHRGEPAAVILLALQQGLEGHPEVYLAPAGRALDEPAGMSRPSVKLGASVGRAPAGDGTGHWRCFFTSSVRLTSVGRGRW